MSLQHSQILKNRYEIDCLLGQGGMGAAYRALDTLPSLPSPVALKERNLTGLPEDTDKDHISTGEIQEI